jgi:ABC-type transport system involved in multi-copper enzyme maturation permease subunit
MRPIFAVYKRELALYFRSPVAYAIAFALMFFFGLLFSSNIAQVVDFNLQASQFGQQPPVPCRAASNNAFAGGREP